MNNNLLLFCDTCGEMKKINYKYENDDLLINCECIKEKKKRTYLVELFLNNKFTTVPKLICTTHNSSFTNWCEDCKINTCDLCLGNHKNHKITKLSALLIDQNDINILDKIVVKFGEKLQQKRESSLRARKMIITRIKNSKDSMEEKKDNGKNENIRKIEIKIKEEYKNYKRADSYNDIRTRFNLKKNLEKNKYLNENSNNKNPIDTFGINYKNKGKIDNTKIMSNNQKNNYLLNKNIRHIYKKNIIKTTTLKHTKVLNFERKNDFKKNDNINKKYIFDNETINKNTKIQFLEIKPTNISNINYRNNNNLYKRFHTEENIKESLISKINKKTMLSIDDLEQKNIQLKENCPNNKNKEINKNNYYNNMNEFMIKRIKAIKNNDHNEKNFLSYYNYLETKGNRKYQFCSESNDSSKSFKVEPYNNKTYIKSKINNKLYTISKKALPDNYNLKNVESEKIDIEGEELFDKKDFQTKFFENIFRK